MITFSANALGDVVAEQTRTSRNNELVNPPHEGPTITPVLLVLQVELFHERSGDARLFMPVGATKSMNRK